jgi:hypothetical protein
MVLLGRSWGRFSLRSYIYTFSLINKWGGGGRAGGGGRCSRCGALQAVCRVSCTRPPPHILYFTVCLACVSATHVTYTLYKSAYTV